MLATISKISNSEDVARWFTEMKMWGFDVLLIKAKSFSKMLQLSQDIADQSALFRKNPYEWDRRIKGKHSPCSTMFCSISFISFIWNLNWGDSSSFMCNINKYSKQLFVIIKYIFSKGSSDILRRVQESGFQPTLMKQKWIPNFWSLLYKILKFGLQICSIKFIQWLQDFISNQRKRFSS